MKVCLSARGKGCDGQDENFAYPHRMIYSTQIVPGNIIPGEQVREDGVRPESRAGMFHAVNKNDP